MSTGGRPARADNAADGVVDADGEVYGHPGLYVVDGATVPSALGVNPSLTIAALAPTALPGFPGELRPHFGYGRGGIRFLGRIPVVPERAEKAQQSDPYPRPATGA